MEGESYSRLLTPKQASGNAQTLGFKRRHISTIHKGQRWMSETEPELGLGTITHADGRYVDIAFATRETNRRYSIANAPLTRIVFKPGDAIHDKSGATFTVASIHDDAEN